MSSPIQSLIVKEWHEQKWRCASLSAIGVAVVVFSILRTPEVASYFGMVAMFSQAFFGTVFIAMGVAAGDRSAGTLELLRALPIRMTKVASIKLIVGLVTCLIPIILVAVVFAIWLGLVYLLPTHEYLTFSEWWNHNGLSTDMDELPRMTTAAIGCCVSIYLWVVVVGIYQRTELRAGLVGIGVLVGWIMLIMFTDLLAGTYSRIYFSPFMEMTAFHYIFSVLIGISPYGVCIALMEPHLQVWLIAVAQVLSICLLLTWTLHRYGRVSGHDNASPAEVSVTPADVTLGRPRLSPVTAVAWKQWRDTAPMAVLGLILIAVFVAGPITSDYERLGRGIEIGELKINAAGWIGQTSITIGTLLALVVGAGTFVSDYQPAMLTFWRSRPISPRLWFWSKYLTGLMVVEVTMLSPWLIAEILAENAAQLPGDGHLGTIPLLYLFIYTVAVWMGCLLRHTIYAGLMAGGIVAFVLVGPQIEPKLQWISFGRAYGPGGDGYGLGRWLSFEFLPFFFLMVVLTGIGLWLATRAARRDSAFELGR